MEDLKVKGIVENICKQCGEKFKTVYFEDETEENAKASYCLFCIVGVSREDKRWKSVFGVEE
jgi:Mrp family chromosome partitioning ATPase